ncbi:MAG: lytic transglycosylase domain-containing protein [Syntrophobacterales bacterium]
MRYLILFLSIALTWLVFSDSAPAGPTSALIKNRECSLVLGGTDTKLPRAAKPDMLHTMLSREVQVYIFQGANRVWPQPYVLAPTRSYPSGGRRPKLAGPYLEKLHKYASHYSVDPSLVRAVMRHESGFNPHAVSRKGAQGLMQLMPGTADLMGVQNPFDPEQNIAGGVGYLRLCLDRFGQSVPLAVAAYNAGPARVAKSQGAPRSSRSDIPKSSEWPPNPEAQNSVFPAFPEIPLYTITSSLAETVTRPPWPTTQFSKVSPGPIRAPSQTTVFFSQVPCPTLTSRPRQTPPAKLTPSSNLVPSPTRGSAIRGKNPASPGHAPESSF